MTILWCGGEDIDFYPINIQGGANSFSRYGIFSGLSETFDSITSAWIHAYLVPYAGYNEKLILADKTSGYGIGVMVTGSNIVSIIKHTSTSTNLTSNTPCVSVNTVDLQIINYGTSATLNAYVNSLLMCSYSGDIAIPNVSSFNCINIICEAPYNYPSFSEIIVADTDTRLMRLKTLYPESGGTTTEWSGAYTNIDEATYSDLDNIYSSTANQVSSFNLNTRPAGNYRSLGLKISTRAVSGTSALKLQTGIRTGTTVYLSPTKTVGTYWENFEDLYQVNPVTGLPFTSAEIDSLQLAVKSIAA